MPRKIREITGYGDVSYIERRRERLSSRPCKTGHEMLQFHYGSRDTQRWPNGHCETVTTKREYGKHASNRLTKLFTAFGLLTVVIIAYCLI